MTSNPMETIIMTDQHPDSIAAAEADRVVGETIQPDLVSRVAAVEASSLFLADLITKLANALNASIEREAGLVELNRKIVERGAEIEKRLAVVERRTKVRLMAGRP
jgi:S-adenosylmethionine synthetase